MATLGEGWHNYHHAFPWDYRASEYGTKLNLTTSIIDILAFIRLVWDRKEAPEHFVEYRSKKLGDGTHPIHGYSTEEEYKNIYSKFGNCKHNESEDTNFKDSKYKIKTFL